MPIMSRPILSRLRSPPLNVFLTALPTTAVAAFAEPELDELRFETAHPIASRKMWRSNRGRELQVFLDSQMLVESVFLRDVTDVALQPFEIWIKRLAIEENLAIGRLKLSRQHF